MANSTGASAGSTSLSGKGETNKFEKDPGLTNIVRRIDDLVGAEHEPGNDYDDPYPGGPTPSLGLPIDG